MLRQPVSMLAASLVAFFGASAVLLGAFGAHALTPLLDTRGSELWRTATSYHFWHALALALLVAVGHGRSARFGAMAFACGIVLFSGSLYALALGAPRALGMITPVGGIGFVIGWGCLGMALRGSNKADI